MKTISAKKALRGMCAFIALIFCILSFSGCKSAKLTPSKLALTEVGKVGEETVYYEELYYLASAYKTEGMSSEQLWELINQNIITNHAIITLCRELGVEYDEKQLEDDIQAYVDNIVTTDCGSVSAYRDALKQNFMTDHYMRFVARTDLLYEKVPEALALKGEVISDKQEFTEYVNENFIRTWHFMIANNKGDNKVKNAQDIQAAYEALTSGKTTIYKLTSGKYDLPNGSQNEDIMMPADGYAFTRGNMDTVYESAAFSLKVDEYSNVIMTKSSLANGEYVDCYYIIQRLSLDDEYIDDNYNELYDDYISAMAVQKLDKVKESLTFELNDFAKSLDILALESVGVGTDVGAIIIICVSVLALAGVVVAIVLCVRHVKNNKRSKKGKRRIASKNIKLPAGKSKKK